MRSSGAIRDSLSVNASLSVRSRLLAKQVPQIQPPSAVRSAVAMELFIDSLILPSALPWPIQRSKARRNACNSIEGNGNVPASVDLDES